jgi:hypothetical protein
MKRQRSRKSLRRKKKRRPGSEEAPGELVSRYFPYFSLFLFPTLDDFVEVVPSSV